MALSSRARGGRRRTPKRRWQVTGREGGRERALGAEALSGGPKSHGRGGTIGAATGDAALPGGRDGRPGRRVLEATPLGMERRMGGRAGSQSDPARLLDFPAHAPFRRPHPLLFGSNAGRPVG